MAVYSHSRLSSYENCPRQFEYRYVQKLETEREGIEAFVGKRVHEVLERLYHHLRRHARPPSLRQVLERFNKDWGILWHDKIEIVRKEFDTDHYQAQGRTCLENYYRSQYPFDQEETVAVEHTVQFPLDPAGRYRMRGIIDRIARTGPGAYEVHDYKTGRYLPPAARFETDRQLALYQIGLERAYPDVERVELVWHYLHFNRTIRSRRSPEQLDALQTQTMARIEEIETASEYPAKPSRLCEWCDYRDVCPDAKLPKEASSGLPPAEAARPGTAAEPAASGPAEPGPDSDSTPGPESQLRLI
ncbi:MAG: PD-(D/E)XK nuclease family protein [Myxococcota bacterium]|nr:PD-(D/E)XK nuclease family protein [Myxococcota bacterium]